MRQRTGRPENPFFQADPLSEEEAKNLLQDLVHDPAAFAVFLGCAGRRIAYGLSVNMPQSTGGSAFVISREWVADSVAWLEEGADGQAPKPQDYPLPRFPLPLSEDAQSFAIVSPGQLAAVERAFGRPGDSFTWIDRDALLRVPVTLGVGKKGETVADLRPIPARFERGCLGDPAVSSVPAPPSNVLELRSVSTAHTLEQLRMMSKQAATGAIVDASDRAATADWRYDRPTLTGMGLLLRERSKTHRMQKAQIDLL
jgi:hypothetical protein